MYAAGKTNALRGRLKAANLLQYVDNFRVEHSRRHDLRDGRRELGQFFTPIPVAQQMARFAGPLEGKVSLLDPGAGAGMLSAAVVAQILQAYPRTVNEIEVVAYEVDPRVGAYMRSTLNMCASVCESHGVAFNSTIHFTDFVLAACDYAHSRYKYDVAILNPPYRKIASASAQSRLLKKHGLPHNNLYAAFMMLAAILLKSGGKLVSISPRSFCNGPYFLRFRRALLAQMAISDIHLYHSRKEAFGADAVLQENIILGAVKSRKLAPVNVQSSKGPADEDVVVQSLEADELVDLRDRNLLIRVPIDGHGRKISRIIGGLEHVLHDLDVEVSTGRVVAFRARKLLRAPHAVDSVPLLLPANSVNGKIAWPLERQRKPAAIASNGQSATLLVPNARYVLVKRFSSKEQRRRLSAAVLEPRTLKFDKIGIENHLNYMHRRGAGLPVDLAQGLAAYLNSSIADQYFRLFSGHTQVNASDLRIMKYPCQDTLEALGRRVGEVFPDLAQIDRLVAKALGMDPEVTPSSRAAKIDQALSILSALDGPRQQQNQRSALTLLALAGIKPGDGWSRASAPLRGITEMMEFFATHYGVTYKPNTRETLRRQTVHQLWQMGLVVPNPDEPTRPVNSPKYCYQLAPDFLELLQSFEDDSWSDSLSLFRLRAGDRLTALEGRKRRMRMLPVTLPDGSEVRLTEGGQNRLIKQIAEEFCPRFARDGEILYIGDAGTKLGELQIRRLSALGITLDPHGKAPDLIVHVKESNWLLLIEAVTSHGPIDQKRHNELQQLFSSSSAGLVFVTAFATRQDMSKHLKEISWETEVWIAESPDHLIHFDGKRFLGPY